MIGVRVNCPDGSLVQTLYGQNAHDTEHRPASGGDPGAFTPASFAWGGRFQRRTTR
jgi:hypothetical protein